MHSNLIVAAIALIFPLASVAADADADAKAKATIGAGSADRDAEGATVGPRKSGPTPGAAGTGSSGPEVRSAPAQGQAKAGVKRPSEGTGNAAELNVMKEKADAAVDKNSEAK